MSAPTELDEQAIRRGIFVPRPPQQRRGRTLRLVTDDRRSGDAIALLSREHDQTCRDAVDPAEIAAGLEATGLSDRDARETYHVASVFDLAAILYDLVPRRLTPAPPQRDPWSYPLRRHLGRGVLYALPTFPYLAALRLIGTEPQGVSLLLGASVVALAATHGLSHLGHLLVGYGGQRSAAQLLRRALYVTTLAGCVVVGALVLAGLPRVPLCIGLAQLVYVVAATVVMVFEKDRLLFLALVPGIATAVAALVADELTPTLQREVAAGLVACVLLAFVSAQWTTHQVDRQTPGGVVRLVPREVCRGLEHAGYGAVVAGLLMFAILDAMWSGAGSSHTLVGVEMLPLVITLGVAEWQLHLFRSDSEVIQHCTHDFRSFARAVRLALLRRVSTYAVVVATASAAVFAIVRAEGSVDATVAWRLGGYGVLGVALFVASVLLSCGIVTRTVVCLGTTLLAQLGLLVLLHRSVLPLTVAQAGVFAVLLLVLGTGATRTLRSPLWFR